MSKHAVKKTRNGRRKRSTRRKEFEVVMVGGGDWPNDSMPASLSDERLYGGPPRDSFYLHPRDRIFGGGASEALPFRHKRRRASGGRGRQV
jgi:hypothetical protein